MSGFQRHLNRIATNPALAEISLHHGGLSIVRAQGRKVSRDRSIQFVCFGVDPFETVLHLLENWSDDLLFCFVAGGHQVAFVFDFAAQVRSIQLISHAAVCIVLYCIAIELKKNNN